MAVKQRQSLSNRLKTMVKSNPLSMKISESEIAVPTDQQARMTQLIQTQAGVSILPNAWNTGAWIDSHVDGSPLTNLSISALMTAGTGLTINIDYSHDNGATVFSGYVVYSGTASGYSTSQDIQLPARHFRVSIQNKDATNPKVTTAYAYLKS